MTRRERTFRILAGILSLLIWKRAADAQAAIDASHAEDDRG